MEVWKDIKGYEGLYQVSNLGRVRSLDRVVMNNGKQMLRRGKILKSCLNSAKYCIVVLSKEGKHNVCSVHRLVAEAFIPNPDNLPIINHKNEIRTDNKVENLEYCTIQYNIEYSLAKSVLQYDLQGNFIKEYPSVSKASKHTNINPANINSCCRKRKHYYTAGGYIWKYKEERAA